MAAPTILKPAPSFQPFRGWRGQFIAVDLRFDEGQGAPFDYGGHLHNGILAITGGSAVVPNWTPTTNGFALHTNGQIDLDASFAEYNSFTWPYDVITMEMLVRPFAKSGLEVLQRIWSNGDTFEIGWRDTTELFGWDAFSAGLDGVDSPVATAGEWHHVIATADGRGASGRKRAWLNGVPGTAETTTNAAASTGALRIGHRVGADGAQGALCDYVFIRMYREIATDDQIGAMFRDPYGLSADPGIRPISNTRATVSEALESVADIQPTVLESKQEITGVQAVALEHSVDMVLRPEADVGGNPDAWVDQTAGTTDIYQSIDEETPSDADWIESR